MAIIFITGLSGVGASTVLHELEKEGYNVVDTDIGYIKYTENNGMIERDWDEEKIAELIENYKHTDLIISGCYANQGKFYNHFKHVVLLKANLDVMLDRVAKRTTNNYGKTPEERQEIINNYDIVLPLLEKSSDIIIDTTEISIDEVCRQIKELL